jgi:hypothetical protein
VILYCIGGFKGYFEISSFKYFVYTCSLFSYVSKGGPSFCAVFVTVLCLTYLPTSTIAFMKSLFRVLIFGHDVFYYIFLVRLVLYEICHPTERKMLAISYFTHRMNTYPIHPNLPKILDGTPQNFASRKGGTKLYMAINMYLHINLCPVRMQAYENKT